MEIEDSKKTQPENYKITGKDQLDQKLDKEKRSVKIYGIVVLVAIAVIAISAIVLINMNNENAKATPLNQLPEGSKLRILHFGDCYNIQEEDDGSGGAAKFVTALDHYRDEAKSDSEVVTLFAGDMFGPSLISTVFEGQQLVEPFNQMKVDASVIGNHELDFGIARLEEIVKQIKQPNGQSEWIMSNLHKKESGETLADMPETYIIEKGPFKIGVIGIAEQEWLDTFNDLEEELVLTDQVETANRLVKELREEKGCNMVIALTHAWLKNDQELAKAVPGIDLILGGHDHDIYLEAQQSEGTSNKEVPLVKSGHDFHDLSIIDISMQIDPEKYEQAKTAAQDTDRRLMYSEQDKMMFEITQVDVDSQDFEPHPETAATSKAIMDDLYEKMKVDIGYTGVELESRKQIIRTQETNFPNLMADLIRTEYLTDFGFVNMGAIRLNDVIPVGPFTHLQMQEMLPYPDIMTVLEVPGSIVKEALEHSVSYYPLAEGNWLAVSGLKFTFDASKPAYDRINPQDILLPSGESIDLSGKYSLAVNSYVGGGGDGYECFTKPEVKLLVDPENTSGLIEMLLQFQKRTSTVYTVKPANEDKRQTRLALFNTSSTNPEDISPDGEWIIIRPQVEGRITILNN